MAVERFNGTWKLNREKSDIPPVTQSQVIEIETDGSRISMRETLVNDKGLDMHVHV